MPSVAIVDSGPLIASAIRSDPDHGASLDALRTPGGPIPHGRRHNHQPKG